MQTMDINTSSTMFQKVGYILKSIVLDSNTGSINYGLKKLLEK